MFKKYSNQHELGFIKSRFFDSITIFKPAVSVFVYDMESTPVGQFDWPACEKYIMDEIKNFQETCVVSAKDTKIIILTILPLNEEVNADECRNSLKRAFMMKNPTTGDEQVNTNIKHILTVSSGVQGLKQSPKDFVKKIFEASTQYYSNKKRDTKNKQKKLINKE